MRLFSYIVALALYPARIPIFALGFLWGCAVDSFRAGAEYWDSL
jgi:hypothetical protein